MSQNNSSKKGITIPKIENARRLVIPDIHGCSKTLQNLLEKINLTKTDQLFFLGDYIDRGPDSKGVLDVVMGLIDDNYQIFPLRGNHEDELVRFAAEPNIINHLAQQSNLKGIVNQYFEVDPLYFDFMNQLPFYYQLDEFYLVHAGFNFEAANPFEDYDEMLWIRDFELNESFLEGKKTIIHGHTPESFFTIYKTIENEEPVINLDNGCVFKGINSVYKGLLCYDLDSKDLVCQENIDMERFFRR